MPFNVEGTAGVGQGERDGLVGDDFGVEVSDQTDTDEHAGGSGGWAGGLGDYASLMRCGWVGLGFFGRAACPALPDLEPFTA
ncbi:hypothetical protein JCM19000A_07050 [Silvimonas sp. JCM 19000]